MFRFRWLAVCLALWLVGLVPLAEMASAKGRGCCCTEICLLAAKKLGGGCHESSSGALRRSCPRGGGHATTVAGLTHPSILPQPVLLEVPRTGERLAFRMPVTPTLEAPRPPTPPPKPASSFS